MIAGVHEGDNVCHYNIAYDDGDSEQGVAPGMLRKVQMHDYEVCNRVEANFNGKGTWFAGRISDVTGSTYTIHYDDGDMEEGVSACNLKPLTGSSETFDVGQHVEGNWQGRGEWHSGVISDVVSDCCYTIDYADGDKEECVDPIFIRDNDFVCEYHAGTKVEANWKGYGAWYPATVSQCEMSGYELDYDDGDQESGVGADRVRLITCDELFPVGEKVQSDYKGRGTYYPGTVESYDQDDCSYCISYDDGDHECHQLETRLMENTCDESGETITANWQGGGTWYDAKVCGCDPNDTYFICYDDGDKENNVPADRIRFQ